MRHKIADDKRFQHAVDVPASTYRDSSESFRDISPRRVACPKSHPRVLLVDDDPTFGKLMTRAASSKGLQLTYCESLKDFMGNKNWDYDVVIMDYDLGAISGFELTRHLEHSVKEEIPVILVSQTKQSNTKKWPRTIREFVHKNLGPFAILQATIEAHELTLVYKEVRRGRSLH